MGRIKIEDLPEDQKITKDIMRKVFGGIIINDLPPSFRYFSSQRFSFGGDQAIPINIP